MYALVKEDEILYFVDEIPKKFIPATYKEENIEKFEDQEIDGEIKSVSIGFKLENILVSEEVPGVAFDKAIKLEEEYNCANEYILSNGKIIVNVPVIENKSEEISIIKTRTAEDVLADLGRMSNIKDGLKLVGEDISEINIKIDELKLEYNEIKLEVISE